MANFSYSYILWVGNGPGAFLAGRIIPDTRTETDQYASGN